MGDQYHDLDSFSSFEIVVDGRDYLFHRICYFFREVGVPSREAGARYQAVSPAVVELEVLFVRPFIRADAVSAREGEVFEAVVLRRSRRVASVGRPVDRDCHRGQVVDVREFFARREGVFHLCVVGLVCETCGVAYGHTCRVGGGSVRWAEGVVSRGAGVRRCYV